MPRQHAFSNPMFCQMLRMLLAPECRVIQWDCGADLSQYTSKWAYETWNAQAHTKKVIAMMADTFEIMSHLHHS
eukprot:scaffold251258_cov14-Prasinocladus_malaysianus.AAC.1